MAFASGIPLRSNSAFAANRFRRAPDDPLLWACDHGWQYTRHPGFEQPSDGPSNCFVRRCRIVVIHARETVHLEINEPRGNEAGNISSADQVIDSLDRTAISNLDRGAGSHRSSVLFSRREFRIIL